MQQYYVVSECGCGEFGDERILCGDERRYYVVSDCGCGEYGDETISCGE